MADFEFTEYFEKEVLRKRPYLKKEWCIEVVKNPIKVEPQDRNITVSGFGVSFLSLKVKY